MATARTCTECGVELAADLPEGLCLQCLLKRGLDQSLSATPTVVDQTATGAAADRARTAALPCEGQLFGGYHIVRLLGKGGMGVVYEAEHLESSRRVALKVLDHSLDSEAARKRFLREGRLAASINHPNSVYIYGAEEVAGIPIITMELLPGGTLRDRIDEHGTMRVADAVGAILQVIAGLEAAAAKGILHRDIKPSNCFVETNGTVKVGDFGLSISTRLREESQSSGRGTVLGTPSYASPEQLRGDDLDVRSDIYSVGVTLYYLLTGQTPFRSDNLGQLIATVLEKPAPVPSEHRPEVPRGLDRVLLRCLEKRPENRFKDYQSLRSALAPYDPTASPIAPLVIRSLAGAVDFALVTSLQMLFGFALVGFSSTGDLEPAKPWLSAVSHLLILAYYLFFEGVFQASPGKALCGLRIADVGRGRWRIGRVALRTTIFLAITYGDEWVPWNRLGSLSILGGSLGLLVWAAACLILFCTSRRRNGFAALHDLASSTRVVRRQPVFVPTASLVEGGDLPLDEVTRRIGPYSVLNTLRQSEHEELLVAFDPRLLRKVWIHQVRYSEGPPPLRLWTNDSSGHLRWLSGRQDVAARWDAYEFAPGKPFVALLQQPQPWANVRRWLLDLAQALKTERDHGVLPPILDLSRIWITEGGQAKWLSFPAPNAAGEKDDRPRNDAVRNSACIESNFDGSRMTADERIKTFLRHVACVALKGRSTSVRHRANERPDIPLPLHAQGFLGRVLSSASVEHVVEDLKALVQRVPRVSRVRRFILIAGVGSPGLGVALFFSLVYLISPLIERRGFPVPSELFRCLERILNLEAGKSSASELIEVRALETYLAGRYRSMMKDPGVWSNGMVHLTTQEGPSAQNERLAEVRKRAEQIMAKHPAPPEATEFRKAMDRLKPFLTQSRKAPTAGEVVQGGLMYVFGLLATVGAASIGMALICKRGLMMYALNLVVVRHNGQPADRWNCFVRQIVIWSPVIAALMLGPLVLRDLLQSQLVGLVALGYGVSWALISPECGLAERVSATCLVPE